MLYKDGATAVELARAYNIGENTVYGAVAEHGVPRHYPRVSNALRLAHIRRREGATIDAEEAGELPVMPPPPEPTLPTSPKRKYVKRKKSWLRRLVDRFIK